MHHSNTTFSLQQDLYSVMIRGPERTPYEDGLFFFDFQLSADYPRAPPLCHYVTYCSDKLNPNLYEDGKVYQLSEYFLFYFSGLKNVQRAIIINSNQNQESIMNKQGSYFSLCFFFYLAI